MTAVAADTTAQGDVFVRDSERLVERVLAGEVVFFVGAGFSLDSENNTAKRLMARLLARFLAIYAFLKMELHGSRKRERKRMEPLVDEIYDGLKFLFEIDFKAPMYSKTAKKLEWKKFLKDLKSAHHHDNSYAVTFFEAAVQKLAGNYYEANEWMLNAFDDYIGFLRKKMRKTSSDESNINQLEKEILEIVNEDPDTVRRVELDKLFKLSSPDRGKALFLDTMGFDDERVMMGLPTDAGGTAKTQSVGRRLRPRHHVLARLAREGLSPTLLTTNFDTLVEGAYQLAGLSHDTSRNRNRDPQGLSSLQRLPPTTCRTFKRIARDTDFFGQGNGREEARIVKLHGCVDRYREEKNARIESWQAYLPAIVFSYREIQNWRQDAWSRDLVRGLVRTNTVVFCGYSGADPVIHDTFRTVYEEMSARRKAGLVAAQVQMNALKAPVQRAAQDSHEAPAFFFGLKDQPEFHALEILRGASRAEGVSNPDLTRHPNRLLFYLRRGAQHQFPDLDELFVWLFHRVLRRRQTEALDFHLRRTASLVLRHPAPESEVRSIQENFGKLLCTEQEIAGQWDNTPDSRLEFEWLTAWTDRFHVAVLRELALAETILRSRGPGLDTAPLRRQPWYFPSAEHPEWTAWGAILEIALRKMLAAWRGEPTTWADVVGRANTARGRDAPPPKILVEPARGSVVPPPAILYSTSHDRQAPTCLGITLGFDRHAWKPDAQGYFRAVCAWTLDPASMPWPNEDRKGMPVDTPGAHVLWKWACAPDVARPGIGTPPVSELTRYFGVRD